MEGQAFRASIVNISMGGALLEIMEPAGPAAAGTSAGTLELLHVCGAQRLSLSLDFRVLRRKESWEQGGVLLLGVAFAPMGTDNSIQLYKLVQAQSS